RAEAKDLVGNLLEHPHALGASQGETFLVSDLPEELLDLAADLHLIGEIQLWVELVYEPVLDAVFRLAEGLTRRHRTQEGPWTRLSGWRRRRSGPSGGRGWLGWSSGR